MIRRTSRLSIVFVLCLLIFGLLTPLPFVLVEPGTPSNVFGKVKGKETLEIVGLKSYPTKGKLSLTSIWVTNPESRVQGLELIRAWIDGERSVQPREAFYPKGQDAKKVAKENFADMRNSQLNSKLAALNFLKIPYSEKLFVKGFVKNSSNNKLIKVEDQITSLNGLQITSGAQLRAQIQTAKSGSVDLGIIRKGKVLTLPITIRNVHSDGLKQNIIGIKVFQDFQSQLSVKIRLKNIGGPSAGLIFALAIIEKATEEDLVRGRNIAGTGTIAPSGKVGPIGGIEEKLIGASRAGATLFLVPSLNCPDIRHTPKGLRVVPVDDLVEAVAALRQTDPDALAICG